MSAHGTKLDTLVGVSSAGFVPGGTADDPCWCQLMAPTLTLLLVSALLESLDGKVKVLDKVVVLVVV